MDLHQWKQELILQHCTSKQGPPVVHQNGNLVLKGRSGPCMWPVTAFEQELEHHIDTLSQGLSSM